MVKIRELLFMARSSNDDWKIAPSFRSSRYKRRWEGKNTVIHYYQREPQWVLVRVIFLPLFQRKSGQVTCTLMKGMGWKNSDVPSWQAPCSFFQVQDEPGEAAATGLHLLTVLQEPLTHSRGSEPIPFHRC